MFRCRLLFRNIFMTFDKLSASCKCTASGKPPNVIKTFNTENKSLFGSLLESKTQRRKKISKGTDLPRVSKTLATTDLETLVHNEAPKKKRRSKTTKDIEMLSVLPDTSSSRSTITNGSCGDHLSENNNISELISQKSNNPKTGKGSLNKMDLVNCEESQNEEELQIEESVVSPDKLVSKQDLQDKESRTVVSDNFILNSSVPVNENSFPLDNPNKMALSTSSCSLENILSFGFTDPLVKDYMRFPSVSKIMEDTMSPTSRMVLGKWRKNMVADLGEEGFAKHCTALKERGHEFHEAVRTAVLGQASEACHSDITCNALRSLEWVLRLVTNPLAVESIIAHPRLQYKGIPDCVAMFRGVPVVIDWKLSEKPKKSLKDTYDAPVQISAYMGALNHDPNYKWKVSHGLVAVAYTSGDPCDVFLLAPKHCEIYWRHWLLRFHKFNARSHLHVDHQIDEKALESV